MEHLKSELSKGYVQKGALILEIVGFISAIVTCWLTEYLDPPFNSTQVGIETALIGFLGCATVFFTWQFIKKIKYLEGFMVICAACKSIKVADDTWVSIERMISNKSDLQFSHGVCPGCAVKLYGEYLQEGALRS